MRSALLAIALAGCAHFPAPESSPTCRTDRPELQDVCTEYARAIRQTIVLRVVPDGTAPPLRGDQPDNPWAEIRSGQRAPCTITIQEQHVAQLLVTDRPLRHEAFHCLLWRANNDPDREHAAPWWPQ